MLAGTDENIRMMAAVREFAVRDEKGEVTGAKDTASEEDKRLIERYMDIREYERRTYTKLI